MTDLQNDQQKKSRRNHARNIVCVGLFIVGLRASGLDDPHFSADRSQRTRSGAIQVDPKLLSKTDERTDDNGKPIVRAGESSQSTNMLGGVNGHPSSGNIDLHPSREAPSEENPVNEDISGTRDPRRSAKTGRGETSSANQGADRGISGDVANAPKGVTNASGRNATAGPPIPSGPIPRGPIASTLAGPPGGFPPGTPSALALADPDQPLGTAGPAIPVSGSKQLKSFTLAGRAVTPLFPGAKSELYLFARNPNPDPIVLDTLTVSFIGNSVCDGPTNFAVSRSFRGPVTVPSGDSYISQRAAPQISMRNLPVSQDSCKGAPLALVFRGKAHQ
jgi:hypothetical protein